MFSYLKNRNSLAFPKKQYEVIKELNLKEENNEITFADHSPIPDEIKEFFNQNERYYEFFDSLFKSTAKTGYYHSYNTLSLLNSFLQKNGEDQKKYFPNVLEDIKEFFTKEFNIIKGDNYTLSGFFKKLPNWIFKLSHESQTGDPINIIDRLRGFELARYAIKEKNLDLLHLPQQYVLKTPSGALWLASERIYPHPDNTDNSIWTNLPDPQRKINLQEAEQLLKLVILLKWDDANPSGFMIANDDKLYLIDIKFNSLDRLKRMTAANNLSENLVRKPKLFTTEALQYIKDFNKNEFSKLQDSE